jgi:hypothetical protein
MPRQHPEGLPPVSGFLVLLTVQTPLPEALPTESLGAGMPQGSAPMAGTPVQLQAPTGQKAQATPVPLEAAWRQRPARENPSLAQVSTQEPLARLRSDPTELQHPETAAGNPQ